ncbi:MAG: hypothetical protein ABWW70_05475 [Thermoproteota archaeon]
MESYSHRLPIALLGVPFGERHNPYLVLVSSKPLLGLRVLVDEADGAPGARITGPSLGWRFELALKSFVDVLSSRLEQNLEVELVLDTKLSYPPPSSVYAVATISILRAVAEAGGYELSDEEVIEAARSIDEEAATWMDYIDALRTAAVRGKSLAYRHGEDAVPLGVGGSVELELVGEEDLGADVTSLMPSGVLSALVRFSGMAVIEAINSLRRGSRFSEVFNLASRADNATYYALYGVHPPQEGCKWTPSLQRVYAVCLAGEGLGDTVAFVL